MGAPIQNTVPTLTAKGPVVQPLASATENPLTTEKVKTLASQIPQPKRRSKWCKIATKVTVGVGLLACVAHVALFHLAKIPAVRDFLGLRGFNMTRWGY